MKHTEIPNDVLEALCRLNALGREFQAVLTICRKTYGWHKEWDDISLTQLSEATGIPRSKIPSPIKKLLRKKVIQRREYRAADRRGRSQRIGGYAINPNVSEWLVVPRMGAPGATPPKERKSSGSPISGSSGSPISGNLVVPRMGLTKEILQKKGNKRKLLCPKYSEEHLGLASLLLNNIQKVCTVFNDSDLERAGGLGSWANTIRLMEEREGRRLADIRKIIEWLPGDEFWRNNILSAEALRKKFARLWGDMMDPKRPREKTAEELYEEEMRILKDPGR